MVTRTTMTLAAGLVCVLGAAVAQADEVKANLTKGTPQIESAGPIAFGPPGILLLGDPQSAAIFALEVGQSDSSPQKAVNVEGIDRKIAAALGTEPQDILINDLAVNPADRSIYLSVSRGRGPDAKPVLLRVDGSGKIQDVSLRDIPFSKAKLPNAPADEGTGRQNQRRESITDLAYVDGRVIVAGLSNEEFASKLRAIPFPFDKADEGASVEIFHGAHGRFETRSPVRTFVSFEIDGDPHLLAAYTCTPLVKFPVKDLQAGKKVKGTTIAELGNRNRPLDMIVYRKGGKDYVLMANSSRGLMKITTDGIAEIDGIEQKINDTAGLTYDTIKGMEGIEQLDRLDEAHAAVIMRQKDGRLDLKTIDLP